METSWNVSELNNGIIKTRPGYESGMRLPDGEARGMHMIDDKEGNPCLIMFVDFNAYISKHPFKEYSKLEI